MTLSSEPNMAAEAGVDEIGAQLAELLEPTKKAPAAGENEEEVAEQAAEPDAGEDDEADEAEPSDTDESDDAEEGQEDPEPAQTFTVTVNGEEKQVSLDELQASYQRDADYRQKDQEVTVKAQALDGQLQSLGEWRDRLQAFAGLLHAQLKQEVDPEELNRLKDEDPGLWAARVEEIRQREQLIAQATTQAERIAQVQRGQQQQQLAAYAEEEHGKLLKAVPEWKDPARARTDNEAILGYLASDYAVKPEDLDGLYDHRWILLARKAWLYDKAAKRAPAVAQQAKTVLKTGPAGARTGKRSDIEKSAQRLAQSGRVEDAADIFRSIFE